MKEEKIIVFDFDSYEDASSFMQCCDNYDVEELSGLELKNIKIAITGIKDEDNN